MKNKINCFLITFLLTVVQLILAYNLKATVGELIIGNFSSDSIQVSVYPIGAIFNAEKKYALNSILYQGQKIYGGSKVISAGSNFTLDQDAASGTGANAVIGYGRYRVVFSVFDDQDFIFRDYCDVDYSDSDYPYSNNDITLKFYEDSITFVFSQGSPHKINVVNRYLKIWDQYGGNVHKTQNKSGFQSDSIYTDWPINAFDYGSVNHLSPNDFFVNVLIRNSGINLESNQNAYFKNSALTIGDGFNLAINSSASLNFDEGSHFRSFQTFEKKTVTLGSNALIQMNPYSHLNLNNTIFQTTNSGITWKGLKLTDTYSDTIKNCVFKNTDTCINLYNSGKCIARYKKIITGCKFENGVVKLRNIFNALISNDSFYTTNNNHYLLTISNNIHPSDDPQVECPEEVESYWPFNISVAYNYFSGGAVQMYFNCLASDLTPFYIFGNIFHGSGASSPIGMVSNKISGDLKYNSFLTDDYVTAVDLLQSNLNFYSNYFQSGNNVTVNLLSSSYGLLCPLYAGGNYAWYGGLNLLASDSHSDIYFGGGSNINTNYGSNCFTINNSNYYNISGSLSGDCDESMYEVAGNYWSPSPPRGYVTCNGIFAPLYYEPELIQCEREQPEPVDMDITEIDEGLTDTLFISGLGDFINYNREDEALLSSAISKRRNNEYSNAVTELKGLINNYDSSKFLTAAMDELYLNYMQQDTSNELSATISLFSELDEFIQDKIEQYEYNIPFVEKAYSYYLMCITKEIYYNEAILGYENIMENHPDTTRRLLASWDRSAVVLLQQGSGGGDKEELTQEQKLEKLFSDKPVHLIAKNVFKNASANYIKRGSKYDNTGIRRLESRITKFNPQSRDELDSKIGKDLEMLLGLEGNEANNVQNAIPSEFVLHQNYPNPFNPVTTISFETPKDNFIELKIYDVTGKEIMTLINEYKTAGSYSVDFNGMNFPSGVYFYKLKAGDFSSVRKMVLIK